MLKRKAFRDIKNNLSSFITIFLMTFLGVFVFSGIHSYMDGMGDSGDRFYEENNLQDLWLLGENFDDEAMDEILHVEGVKNAERALVLNTELGGFEGVTIEANFIESNEISVMHIVEGEPFDPAKEGFWLDSYLAENLGLKVGDELSLTYSGYDITAKILGLVNTPDHVYAIKDESAIFPTHKDYGFAYLPVSMFPSDSYVFTNVYVDVESDADIQQVKERLQREVGAAKAVTDREASVSVEAFQSEVEEGRTYSGVFTVLFLFIAILSVVTTMHRFVKKQRTQIGTLKALGIGRKKIQWHYVSYGFYISLVAAVLGVLGGRLVIGNLFIRMEAEYFEVPDMRVKTLPVVYIAAFLVILMITFTTWLSCRKVLKEPASEALRLEVPKVKAGEIKPALGFVGRLSVGVRWNLRDISRNKGRTVTGIAGIIGCTMLIVCAFGMRNTMDFFIKWQFERLYGFAYKLSLETGISDEDLGRIYEDYGTASSMSIAVEAVDAEGTKSTQQVVVNDGEEFLRYTDHKAGYTHISDEGMYISEKLSDSLGLGIGDEVVWSIYGEDREFCTEIVGTFREPQGQSFAVTRAYARSLGIDYKPDSVYTDKDLSGVESIAGVSVIQDKAALENGMLSMMDMMNTVVALLIVVSIILAVVIIYNLGILSFSEKQYQFATMKVLGFGGKKIKRIYMMQNLWIALVSIAAGLPCGYFMTAVIFDMALGDNYDMLVRIQPVTYIISAVGIFAVTWLVNVLLAGKVKSIDMVSSLKANE